MAQDKQQIPEQLLSDDTAKPTKSKKPFILWLVFAVLMLVVIFAVYSLYYNSDHYNSIFTKSALKPEPQAPYLIQEQNNGKQKQEDLKKIKILQKSIEDRLDNIEKNQITKKTISKLAQEVIETKQTVGSLKLHNLNTIKKLEDLIINSNKSLIAKLIKKPEQTQEQIQEQAQEQAQEKTDIPFLSTSMDADHYNSTFAKSALKPEPQAPYLIEEQNNGNQKQEELQKIKILQKSTEDRLIAKLIKKPEQTQEKADIPFLSISMDADHYNSTFAKSALKPEPQAPYLIQEQNNGNQKQEELQKIKILQKSIEDRLDNIEKNQITKKTISKLAQEVIETKQTVGSLKLHNNSIYANNLNAIKKLEDLIINSNKSLVAKLIKKPEQTQEQIQEQAQEQAQEKTDIPFLLISIDIWNNVPQATIQLNSKMSIVDVGDKRLGWKIIDISFEKEQIQISKDGEQLTLEVIR